MPFVLCASVTEALACEPCSKMLSIEALVAKSEVIVSGERTDTEPLENKPSTITFKASHVHRGDFPDYPVKLAAFSGMCPYGVVVKPGSYVLFLKKEGGVWKTVETCSPRSLRRISGRVKLKGHLIDDQRFEQWLRRYPYEPAKPEKEKSNS